MARALAAAECSLAVGFSRTVILRNVFYKAFKLSTAPTTAAPAPLITVALVGNPNTGKSTLFNGLSGTQAATGNYPGVTVEKKVGRTLLGNRVLQIVDLPGTYSLAPRTLDEMVTVNVLLGRQADIGSPHGVICIVDASNLERNLYVFSQVLEMGLPTVLVLNLMDVAESRGIRIDVAALRKKLGVPVVVTQAHRRRGLDEVRTALATAIAAGPVPAPRLFPPEFQAECAALQQFLADRGQAGVPDFLLERLLLDVGGYLESHVPIPQPGELPEFLAAARGRLAHAGCKVPAIEARLRYRWSKELLTGIVQHPAVRPVTFSDKLDRWLTHRFVGLGFFVVLMFLMFLAIYTGAAPLMEGVKAGKDWLAAQAVAFFAPGPLQSLLADGVIGGVGGVLIFLPQIVILFCFIALLEDCGYMARAAFLMDKLMTGVGLSGKSFVPLMSSFACAIPGVMATRVIENRRDRLTTILIAPLMSCSARMPIYLLMIGVLIPDTPNDSKSHLLRSLALLGMTGLGGVIAIPVAWLFKKTLFKGETPPFVMELPSYKWPSPRIVLRRMYDSGRSFVRRAGTLIFATSILIWAASYFPGDHRELYAVQRQKTELAANTALAEEARAAASAELEDREKHLSANLLEQSALGRFGQAIEPLVKPLGWDWKIGVGVISSFPAREVIIGTLGTIYSLGKDVSEEDPGLQAAVKSAVWPDGRKVYTPPVALSILVFFALCAQCMSTLMVIGRETNSWVWPAFTFAYMTTLAYTVAWITYHVAGIWWS